MKLFPTLRKYLFNSAINSVFIIHLFLVFLISTGAIDRIWTWLILLMLSFFIAFQPLKDSILLFSRSIPFYIAIPVTASFDSFNIWRIIVFLIAFKWFFAAKSDIINFLRIRVVKNNLINFWFFYKIEVLFFLFFIFLFISLFKAEFLFDGAKRLIYFANLSLILPVIIWIFSRKIITICEISKNISISLAIIILIGFLQLFSAFFLDINEFMALWAGQVQLGFYGTNWSNIIFSGNTWFSYNIGYPKLRMFSTFPDSHTFPLFLILCLPAFITVSFDKIKKIIKSAKSSIYNQSDYFGKKAFSQKIMEFIIKFYRQNKKELPYLFILFFVFLAIISSGTRGIWISILFPLSFIYILSKTPGVFNKIGFFDFKIINDWGLIKKINALILVFFIAFASSYVILKKDQFLFKAETPEQQGKILNRIMSIVDISETSNNLRLEIWKKSLESIARNPLFGVGVGNFPVVLNQNISALKAGASAHNLYLNILAETGIISLIIFLAICCLILKYSWEIFVKTRDKETKIYGYSFFLYSLWFFGYNLTDAALFDERVFLMFILTTGIIVGTKKSIELQKIIK